jgi:general secretion pathway protein G
MRLLISKNEPNRRNGRGGFTLIELLVVMVIISILASIVGVAAVRRIGQAKITKAQAELATLKQAVTAFNVDNGRVPTSSEGLNALIAKPDESLDNWEKTLDTDTVPLDPWGHAYIYRSPGSNGNDYDLLSAGPDGQEGTSDDIKPK